MGLVSGVDLGGIRGVIRVHSMKLFSVHYFQSNRKDTKVPKLKLESNVLNSVFVMPTFHPVCTSIISYVRRDEFAFEAGV